MRGVAMVTERRIWGVVDAVEAVVGLVVQRVDLPDGEVSWTVLDAGYSVVELADRFLVHLTGRLKFA